MTDVWVTRPARQAQATAAKLSDLGYTPWQLPVLMIEPVPLSGADRSKVMDLDHYHHVIFISQNAVRFGVAAIDEFWPQIPAGLLCWAVGSATASLLGQYGAGALAPDRAMTSEGLLAMPDLQDLEHERILIFKGEGGRDHLAKELRRRGAAVDECHLYRRCGNPQAVAELLASNFGSDASLSRRAAIMIYSGESLELLYSTINEAKRADLQVLPLVTPGARVAEMAKELGFSGIVIADNASDEAMLAALTQSVPAH